MERRVVVKLHSGLVLGKIWTNRMLSVDEAMELLDMEPTDYEKEYVEKGYKAEYFYGPDGKGFHISEVVFDDEE
ncbi:hypothetical protein [Megasphaera massiliensis]|uniref:hypothetical protein n=1 Tax=Megasphaera massiliensis TaxID=1232428 RepID=UPI003AB21F9D